MKEPPTAGSKGVPTWVLVLLGVLFAATLAIGSVTLYLVSELENQTAQAQETAKAVTATKALLDIVAARQLKSQDVPAKVESAVAETTTLLNETQAAIDATNEAIAATNQTLDETNALIAQAEAAAAKAQQSAASLGSQLDGLEQGQQKLANKLNQELAKIRARLTNIENRLEQLS